MPKEKRSAKDMPFVTAKEEIERMKIVLDCEVAGESTNQQADEDEKCDDFGFA